MQEVTGAPTLAISPSAGGIQPPKPRIPLLEHTKLCPRAASRRLRGPSVLLAHSVLQLHFPAGFETALLSVRFAAVSSPFSFGHLLFPSPSLPRVGGGTGGFGSQWQWEEGEGSESSCRGSSWYKALLVAQLSAFKSTYFPYQGVRLSHLVSFHYIFD